MKFTALASGSSGNCYYIENKNSAILVDAGISCKQTLSALSSLNLSPKKLQAIFLTHEHSDHIKGADVLARTLNLPIFTTEKTLRNKFICLNPKLLYALPRDQLKIGSLKISAYKKSHQALDPVFFSIFDQNKKISIITDAGYACKNIINAVKTSHALFLESNHDLAMLQSGNYPAYLKKWILSDTGHLSNLQASLLVLEHASPKLQHIILSHLSENNNTPELALSTFKMLTSERKNFSPNIEISSRFHPTSILEI
jgi:phosphoribosyl 1,2-cyclic phosphodiesterase